MKSYHLKWASHLPNMGEVFNTLYQSEGLADVTLACEDGSVKAHKLILSTCSDYFLELFLESTSKRTVVVIPHIKVSDLKDLMGFIYTGEVNVNDDSLSSLLEVADILGVRGLKYNKPSSDEENGDEGVPDEEPREEPSVVNQSSPEDDQTMESTDTMEFVKTEVDPIHIKTEMSTTDETDDTEMAPVDPIAYQNQHTEVPAVQQQPPYTSHQQYGSSPSVTYGILSQTNQILNQISQEHVVPRPSPAVITPVQPQPQLTAYHTAAQGTTITTASQASSPLVSMSNLAAMYQAAQVQSMSQPSPRNTTSPIKIKPKVQQNGEKDLNFYRTMAMEGKHIDLQPEDMNIILSQVTSPICPICNKDCANLPNLRSHLQVHNSIKPFCCTFCDSKFARVSHLNRHIRTHTGERPFPCTLCDKSFARQDKLKVHMDRHNKEGGMSMLQVSKKKKKEKSPIKTDMEAPIQDQMGSHYNSGSLWNGFPMYENYQPVYPGMVNQYVPPLHNVMRIGECSIKPIGQ